jgi:apolipoprotein D and lipocalin family protein
MNYSHTVSHVDIPRFMGSWYVWAGRTTFIERGAYGSIEKYTWNAQEDRIDVDFTFHKGSFDGDLKSHPQKAWIEDKTTNAHWKVQPFWPLKFDYLVIDLDVDYQWTAIGVPNGSYLWIMGRTPVVSDEQLAGIIDRLKTLGYPVDGVVRVPQRE